MKKTKLVLITTAICLLPVTLSFALFAELPEQVAVHFDGGGNPDLYIPKALAAFGLPLLLAAINLAGGIVRYNDPKTENASAAVKLLAAVLVPLVSVVMVPVTLFIALGTDIPLHRILPATVGAVIAVIGNYLPKSRQNYTVGIKLPWTLHSETNWNRTHRFAGYLWVAGGLFLTAAGLLNMGALPLLVVVALLVLLPAIYSFVLYRTERSR